MRYRIITLPRMRVEALGDHWLTDSEMSEALQAALIPGEQVGNLSVSMHEIVVLVGFNL